MFAVLINDSRHPFRYSGIYSLATHLRKNGYSVKVLDFFFHNDLERMSLLLNHYITPETRIVGFSTTLAVRPVYVGSGRGRSYGTGMSRKNRKNEISTIFLEDDFSVDRSFMEIIINIVKNINSDVQIVTGGSNNIFQSLDLVDWHVIGEGENALLAIARHLDVGDPIRYTVRNGARIVKNEYYPYDEFSQSFIEYKEDDYISFGEFLPLETTRGCVYKCKFCTFKKKSLDQKDQFKDPVLLKDWLNKNYEQYGIYGYYITDETFNESLEKIKSYYPVFTNLPFKPELIGMGRLDMFYRYPEMGEMLLDMGLVSIEFGVETLDENAGKIIGKSFEKRKVFETLKGLKEIWGDKVEMMVNMIIGLPEEKEDHIKQSILSLYESGYVDRIHPNVLMLFKADETLSGLASQKLVGLVGDMIELYTEDELSDLVKRGYFHGSIEILSHFLKRNYIWKHKEMDYFRAYEVRREIEDRMDYHKLRFKTDYYYAMSRNLGYSRENLHDGDFHIDALEWDRKKDDYIYTYLDNLYYDSIYQ